MSEAFPEVAVVDEFAGGRRERRRVLVDGPHDGARERVGRDQPPLQAWVLKAHIISAPVLVFAVGLVATDHIWRHFRNNVRLGRRSGVSMMWVVAPMVLTGYLIQAVIHPGWLVFLAWLHLACGVVYVLALLLHQVVLWGWRENGKAQTVRDIRPAHLPGQTVASSD